MDNETRKRLADKSGDANNSRPPKYVVPLIRFDGNRGEFRKISKNADGENVEEDLKSPIEFVILKKRRLLSAYSPNQSYFTNEHNSTADKLMLFKVISKTVSLETTGYTDELRAKYQTLKTHEVIYVLYENEVCKMEIKGGSLGGYYDYQKALQSEEKHSFEVVTVVGSEKVKNDQGFVYYKMTFDFKSVDMGFDLIESKIDEVVSACKAADDYTKVKMNEKGRNTSGSTMVDEFADVKAAREREKSAADKAFDNFGKDPSEISPDDIPF